MANGLHLYTFERYDGGGQWTMINRYRCSRQYAEAELRQSARIGGGRYRLLSSRGRVVLHAGVVGAPAAVAAN